MAQPQTHSDDFTALLIQADVAFATAARRLRAAAATRLDDKTARHLDAMAGQSDGLRAELRKTWYLGAGP